MLLFSQVAKVAVELLEWVLRTGYPVAPLKHAGRWETQTFLEHIQTELTSDPRVRIALREELFPLAYEPSFASAALTGKFFFLGLVGRRVVTKQRLGIVSGTDTGFSEGGVCDGQGGPLRGGGGDRPCRRKITI